MYDDELKCEKWGKSLQYEIQKWTKQLRMIYVYFVIGFYHFYLYHTHVFVYFWIRFVFASLFVREIVRCHRMIV